MRRLQKGMYPITDMSEWPSNEVVPPMITDIDGTLIRPDEQVNVMSDGLPLLTHNLRL